MIKEEGKSDEQCQKLFDAIQSSSFSLDKANEDPVLKEYHSVKERLSIADGIIMYCFDDNCHRVVIPRKLRKMVIVNLHAANQGETSMLSRARQTIYWPGMDAYINERYDLCLKCKQNAPSIQKEPMIPSDDTR